MSTYKRIDPNTINITTFKAHKSWSCTQSTAENINVVVRTGVSSSAPIRELGDSNSDGTYKSLVWRSMYNLYYDVSSSNYYSYIKSDAVSHISRSIGDNILVINIGKDTFGEALHKGSIYITSGSNIFVDDSNYNLIISGSNVVIGNVIYEQGLIIITDTQYSSTFNTYDINFQSTLTLTEYEYPCVINVNDFNYTQNLTSLNENDEFISTFYSSSESPLITSIGLYNELNELLMIAKLPRPYRRNYNLDTTFIIKLDT